MFNKIGLIKWKDHKSHSHSLHTRSDTSSTSMFSMFSPRVEPHLLFRHEQIDIYLIHAEREFLIHLLGPMSG